MSSKHDDTPIDTTSSFWQRVFLYNFTPAQSNVVVALTPELHVSEARPDPSISTFAHLVLSLVYFPSCIGFVVFVMYTWAIRPTTEAFEVVSASSFGPVDVSIMMNCSNPPYCGNMSLRMNYSSLLGGGSGGGCSGIPPALYTAAASGVLGPVVLPLCSVGAQLFTTHSTTPFFPIAGILAEFAAVNPGLNASTPPNQAMPGRQAYGIVTISVRNPSSSSIRIVTMDTWQVKTALIGQTVTDDFTVSPPARSVQAYPLGIQYDGKRASWRSTCIVALANLANHRSFSRTSTLTVLESLGTSSYGSLILLMAFVWIIPVLRLLLPSPDFVQFRQELLKGNQRGQDGDHLVLQEEDAEDGDPLTEQSTKAKSL